jgi:hypothetical protein
MNQRVKNPFFGSDAIVTDVSLEPVRDFLREESSLRSFPFLGSRIIALRFSMSGRSFKTYRPARAMSSSIRRFLGFGVLKMISIDHILFKDFELSESRLYFTADTAKSQATLYNNSSNPQALHFISPSSDTLSAKRKYFLQPTQERY